MPGEHPHHVGGQHLAAAGDVAEAGRLDHRGAVEVALLLGDVAGAHPHPDVERRLVAAITSDALLHGHRARQCVGRRAEHRHDPVAAELHHLTVMTFDGLREQVVVGPPTLVEGVVTEARS